MVVFYFKRLKAAIVNKYEISEKKDFRQNHFEIKSKVT